MSTDFELYTIDDIHNESEDVAILQEESYDEEMEDEIETKKPSRSFSKSFSDAVDTESFQSALQVVLAKVIQTCIY